MDVTRRRSGRLLGLLVLMALLLVGCGGSDEGAGDAAGTTSTAPDTTAPSSPNDSAAEDALVVEVTFANGAVEGDRQAQVPVGEEVTVRVSSDVADEVHVHGYDRFADVAPGEVAELRFVADLAGVWEVELEEAGVQLLQLEVS